MEFDPVQNKAALNSYLTVSLGKPFMHHTEASLQANLKSWLAAG